MTWFAGVVLLLSLSLLWLGGAFAFLPSDAAVARTFTKRHPGFRVSRVVRGDGDNDQLGFQIQYRTPNSSEARTALWLVYSSGVDFGWRLESEDLNVTNGIAATDPQ